MAPPLAPPWRGPRLPSLPTSYLWFLHGLSLPPGVKGGLGIRRNPFMWAVSSLDKKVSCPNKSRNVMKSACITGCLDWGSSHNDTTPIQAIHQRPTGEFPTSSLLVLASSTMSCSHGHKSWGFCQTKRWIFREQNHNFNYRVYQSYYRKNYSILT